MFVHAVPEAFQAFGRLLAAEHATDLVAGQASQPREDVALGPLGFVAAQVADCPQHRFLDDFLAEVAVAADAIEAEAVERLQSRLGQGVDRLGVPRQGETVPGIIEDRLQRLAFLASGLLRRNQGSIILMSGGQ